MPVQTASSAGLEDSNPKKSGVQALLWLIRALALIAVGISAYLAWQSISGKLPAGCGPGSDCDELLAGTWAKWFDIPVSFPAFAVYLGIFLVSFGTKPTTLPASQRRNWTFLTILALIAAGAAIWFAILQFAIVHRICPFCMTVHACGLLIGILTLIALSKLPAKRNDAGYRIVQGIRPSNLWALLLAALAGVGVLITGQVMSSKPLPAMTMGSFDDSTSRPTTRRTLLPPLTTQETPTTIPSATTTAPTKTIVPSVSAETRNLFPIGESDFVDLDPHDLPILGSPSATHRIAILYDYTCPHCRQWHPWLKEAIKRYGDQLVIILLPMPLEAPYNPRIDPRDKRHEHAYELAKIALAVFRIDPAKFSQIDDWLFELQPRSPEDARNYAASLVGEEALKKSEADPWVAAAIKRDIRFYVMRKGGDIPQLLMTKESPKVQFRGNKALFTMLERELDIKPLGPDGKPLTTPGAR
jgi:uncharacterized membrane protein